MGKMGMRGVLWEGVVALNFVHPPACFARVPLRGAKGGGLLCTEPQGPVFLLLVGRGEGGRVFFEGAQAEEAIGGGVGFC